MAVLGAVLLLPADGASANAEGTPFYAGKTVTIIAGFRPGGGVDACARRVARHLARHVPGQPKIAVSNMAGGAGTAAANFLFEKAAPDGLTLAVPGRTWVLSRALGEPTARFDPARFAYIGSPGSGNYKLWLRADADIRSAEALRRSSRKLVLGALSPRSTNGAIPLILSRDGLPITVLSGYAGTPHILEAIMRREIDGIFAAEDTIRATRSTLIDRREILPVLQSAAELPDVPLVETVVSESSRPLYAFAMTVERFGLPLIGPPGLAAQRLAVLRAAYRAMMSDPAYRKELGEDGVPPEGAIEGEKLGHMAAGLIAAATPQVVRRYLEYTRPAPAAPPR